VEAVKAWCEAAGITGGALFRRVFNRRAQRVGAQRLTARIVADIVKAGAARLALDPSEPCRFAPTAHASLARGSPVGVVLVYVSRTASVAGPHLRRAYRADPMWRIRG
jgi:hypothetical protein